jgi:ketosteroid isomerase-like protein
MSQALIDQFWTIEQSRRYSELAAFVSPDVVFFDPMYGRFDGRPAVEALLVKIEASMKDSPTRFELHDTAADDVCGWARWTMHLNGEHPIPGQSLYRFENGLIRFYADYVHTRAFEKAVGKEGRANVERASGGGIGIGDANGPGGDLVAHFWNLQNARAYEPLAALFTHDAVFEDVIYGRFDGHQAIVEYMQEMDREMPEGGITFELVDYAAGTTAAWSQWTCEMPGGSLAGWTVHRIRGDQFTLDADYFDTAKQRHISRRPA